MKKRNQHVVPHKDGWAVKPAGAIKPSKITPTQREAIDVARDRARNQKTELLIHNQKGRIRDRDSYGNDPFPPKG